MARGGGVSSSGFGAWHNQGGGGWNHSGVALDGGAAVHDGGASDRHTWSEDRGFGDGARASGDGQSLASSGGVSDVVLHDGRGRWAEGSVASHNLGGGGSEWGCRWGGGGRRWNASCLVGESAWAVGDCQSGGLWMGVISCATSRVSQRGMEYPSSLRTHRGSSVGHVALNDRSRVWAISGVGRDNLSCLIGGGGRDSLGRAVPPCIGSANEGGSSEDGRLHF